MVRLAPWVILTCLALASASHAAFPQTNNILVITDNAKTKETHSRFIASLTTLGKHIEVAPALSDSLTLIRDGEYVYDAVVLLCPTSPKIARRLPVGDLIHFIDAGGNLFVTAGHAFSDFTEKVAGSMGVDLDVKGAKLIDHQHAISQLDDGSHTFIRAGGHAPSKFLFGEHGADGETDIVFSGPGATLFSDNELVDNVIWGSGSCYSAQGTRPLAKVPRAAGGACVLGATLSTRAGSRAAYFGSFDALSDEVFDRAGVGHEEAMTSLLAWVLGHAGVLRTRNLAHSSMDDSGMVANEYRVKDTIRFSIDVQAWDGGAKVWTPYEADDIQVEFVMLNPWVRQRLQYSGGENGTYTAEIPVPDQIGVYKFNIDYYRPGVSPISVSEVVPVRPYLHNEYERFIGMASPYYAASFSMLVGVFLMGLVVLYDGKHASVSHPKAE